MQYPDVSELGAELAYCEAELEEFEQGAVRYFWSRVIAEELGAVENEVPPVAWSEMGTRERVLLRRRERRTGNTALRVITADASCSAPGQAA